MYEANYSASMNLIKNSRLRRNILIIFNERLGSCEPFLMPPVAFGIEHGVVPFSMLLALWTAALIC